MMIAKGCCQGNWKTGGLSFARSEPVLSSCSFQALTEALDKVTESREMWLAIFYFGGDQFFGPEGN